jgi:hypothetical protein
MVKKPQSTLSERVRGVGRKGVGTDSPPTAPWRGKNRLQRVRGDFVETPIARPEELQAAVSRVERGQHVAVAIWRGAQQQNLDVKFWHCYGLNSVHCCVGALSAIACVFDFQRHSWLAVKFMSTCL